MRMVENDQNELREHGVPEDRDHGEEQEQDNIENEEDVRHDVEPVGMVRYLM